MKTDCIAKKIVFVMFIAFLFVLFSAPLMAAESHFEKGKKYHIEYLGADGDVLLLSEPDDYGWIKVKALDPKFKQYIGDEGLINITNAILATEIK